MSEDFELKLVRIHWQSKDHFGYIDAISHSPIKLTKQEENIYTADIPSYSLLGNKHSQIAFRCISTFNSPPKILQENDTKNLFSVSDPKHGKWWIEKGDWIRQYKYHDAPSCRYVGLFTINIGDITIRLNITPSGFTPVEYQRLLDSFKGELWQLILEKDSHVTTSNDGKGKLPGEEFQREVGKFIKFAEQVLVKPNEELRERQEIQRIEKVRPTSKTFMELAARGTSIKSVTGRGYKPSYNTPENKYIADIVNRLVLVVRNLKNGMQSSKESLETNVKFLQENISQNKNDYIEIDSDKLDAEIEQEESKKRRWEQKKSEFEKYFSIQNEYSSSQNKESICFTVDSAQIDAINPELIVVWYKTKLKDGREVKCGLKFPCDSCNVNFFTKKTKYKISKVHYERYETDNPKIYFGIIKKLSSLEIIDDPHDNVITSLKKERDKYRTENWKRQLNAKEKKDKEIELSAMIKRGEMLTNTAKKYAEKVTNFNSIYQNLLSLSKKCKTLKITVENRLDYPGTMTFVQNPSYRGAYSSFKKIQTEAKFESLFDSLLTIQEFGITDQPNIYEKWCLLQIINVLEGYGFRNEGWETKLVTVISRASRAQCSFDFKNKPLKQSVELIYQPTLPNGTRPDFMLNFRSNNGETVLILDPKNKVYSMVNHNNSPPQFNTFSADLDNLVNTKNYAAKGDNAVFILHPMKEKGFLPVLPTPQSWSYCSSLGGSSVFDWENTDFGPEHKYGGVQVRPENLDNLKMIIAMSLQYLTEDNNGAYNAELKNKEFCIICGGTEFDKVKKCTTSGNHYTCSSCQHFFVKHYCGCCGNRLWKHGSYWTYHDTRSTEPYNIKCPKCGDFYIQRAIKP